MMKKLTTILAVTMLLQSVTASAAYTFNSDKTDAKIGAAAVFDENNTLVGVQKVSLTSSGGQLVSEDISLTGGTVKLFLPDGKTILTGTPKENPTAPSVPEYNAELYPEEHFALFAPAVVKKVQEVYEHNEPVYKLTLLYQGREVDYTANDELLIDVASDAYPDAVGQNTSYLKAGDVIVLNYLFKDTPKNICLIFRPSKNEPIFGEELSNFLPLYTTSMLVAETWSTNLNSEISYRFGVVGEVSDRHITLYEKSGAEIDTADISLHPDASVYSYSMSDKNKTEITGAGGIYETYIPDTAIDGDGNITDWTGTADRVYALVRAIDGAATDIVIYKY